MSTTGPLQSNGALKYGWIFAAVWLFYLSDNVGALWHDPNEWTRYLGLAAVAAFAVTYLIMVRLTRRYRFGTRPPTYNRRSTTALAIMIALFTLQIPGAGYHALTCLVYIAAFGMVSLPLPAGISLAALLCAAAEALTSTVPHWQDNGYGLAVLLGSIATWGLRLAGERQHRLSYAQQEIADLEALARDALTDVRATAMGMRGISLPGEIAAAKEALAAANVEADLPGAADEVPSRNRELFAWTIREAVTNIVRHSKARHAQVKLGPASVEIRDDGVGGAATTADGQGLQGLRRRAEALGARLTVGCRENEPGFRVRVEVPT
jgi:two-component system sensor histidine kinase DesK